MLNNQFRKYKLGIFSAAALIFSLACVALAYDSLIADRLERARDALLDQKARLEESDKRLADSIYELNRKRDRVKIYLIDTDKALQEVDTALHRAR